MRYYASLLAAAFIATSEYAQALTVSGGDATVFDPSTGACGFFNTGDDFVVGIDFFSFSSVPIAGVSTTSPLCGRQMVVSAPGDKTVTATIVDVCSGCRKGSVVLSPAAFDQIITSDVDLVEGISWTVV
ncbi:barwin-like endoglucanase [Lentinus brumalis]|uniref:Barwin-like endoglucanase n=1 Tax=Lentinus brumalis TaxID=2498619 RepID=A0A371CPY9_9APHY|nr:barwin-like endoglucanase [Polyporus brumalis]